jgi:hypothetical protein
MRHITRIFVVLVAMMACVGCFKDEKQGTRMLVQLWSQNTSEEKAQKTTSEIEAYAFAVKKGSKWEVSTWEDALERKITNTENPGEVLTTPEFTGSYDPTAEYQLIFDLWDVEHCFLVIVDITNKVYATRLYDTPMNLPEVKTILHLLAYKKSGSANGWNVTNPFPDEERKPLTPQQDSNDETTDETLTI